MRKNKIGVRLYMSIDEIKQYLKQNKITYNKLAELTGLSISTIKKIFAGTSKYPRVDTIECIERALGFTAVDISKMTAEERQLLKDYRSLDAKSKRLIRDTVSALRK